MDTVALISASPVRQLSNMVHLVMVVRFSTAPIVLLFAQSLKVRQPLLAAMLLLSSELSYLVLCCLNKQQPGNIIFNLQKSGTHISCMSCIFCNDLLCRPYVYQLAC